MHEERLQQLKLVLDEHGYFRRPEHWEPALAELVAKQEGIGLLTEAHWKLIYYLREYYSYFGVAPVANKLCKESGLSLKQLYGLFPTGLRQGAFRIAGLPRTTLSE